MVSAHSDTQRTHRARPLAVIVVAVLAMAVAACSGAAPRPAAVVAADTITEKQLDADLAAEAAVPKKDKTGEPAGSPLLDPDPKKHGVYTAAAKADALSNRILYDLYGQKLAQLHITVSAADRASVHAASCANSKTGKVPPASSCPPLDPFPPAYRAYLLDTSARVVALGNVVYGRVYDQLLAAKSTSLLETCFTGVQVSTATVATNIRAGIAGGATITEASAASVKAGTASAPSPTCRFDATLPPQLTTLAIGGGLTFESGSNLIVVQATARHTGSRADFLADPPTSDATISADVNAEVHRLVATAKITVDPRYGHWDAKALAVIPPGGTAPTTTTAPATTAPATTAPTTTAPTTTAPTTSAQPAAGATSTTTTP